MRYRVSLAAASLLIASAGAYGQSGLTGKWQTDNVPAALEAQKNAPAAPEAGARGGRGGGGGQAIIMDLTADASGKISGNVTEIGNPPVLMIDSGMITGKTITWVTMPRGVVWTLEMTDDNTLTLMSRAIPPRAGGGGAPGGGGGAPGAGGPGGGGGAPGAGAPGGGGGAPGGGGGAPGGGGGAPGGGGGGGGRGRGPQAPIILHRVK